MTRDRVRCFGRWRFRVSFLHDVGFLDFCFLIVSRLAEFNSLLPCFPATYFAAALIPDSLL
jgi:hypothetical protein